MVGIRREPGDGDSVRAATIEELDLAAVNAYFMRYRNLDLFSLVEKQRLDCLQTGNMWRG